LEILVLGSEKASLHWMAEQMAINPTMSLLAAFMVGDVSLFVRMSFQYSSRSAEQDLLFMKIRKMVISASVIENT